MKKRTIAVVVTARPSFSRSKTLIKAIDDHDDLELCLIVAASASLDNFGNIGELAGSQGLKPNYILNTQFAGDSKSVSSKSTAALITELSIIFSNTHIDMVITIADRYETIATSIVAANMNITLIHLQGGEVTGNIDEKIRHANTKLADYHFVTNEDSYERVKKLGEEASSIFNYGCPSIDLVRELDNSKNLKHKISEYKGVGNPVDISLPFLMVLYHPVTTLSNVNEGVVELIESISEFNYPVIWLWPNIDNGTHVITKELRKARESGLLSNVWFIKNFEPLDFLYLLKRTKCLIGNSSVGIRECSALGTPVINLGTRQKNRLRGNNVIDLEIFTKEELKDSIKRIIEGQFECSAEYIYGEGNTGHKIAERIANLPLKYHKTIQY